MQRRPVSQTLSKVLDISNGTAQVVPDLLKAFSILSDTTVRRSSVDREDLKQNWKQKKRRHFSRWSTTVLFTSLLFTLKGRLKNIHKLKNLTPSGLNQDFNQFQVMKFIVYLVSRFPSPFTLHNGQRSFMASLITCQIFTVQL